MAKAKKTNPSTKRSPAAQALWRWLRTAGTYLRIFVRGIVYLLWSKSWIVFTPLGVLLAVFLFSYYIYRNAVCSIFFYLVAFI